MRPVLDLLGEIAGACARATTRIAFARAVASLLSRWVSLQRMEVGWLEPGGTRSKVVGFASTRRRAGALVTEESRDLAGTEVAAALLDGRVRASEDLTAGKGTLRILLPLETHEEGGGSVAFSFRPRSRRSPLRDQAFLVALARILGAAHRHLRLLERVAALSRHAHEETRELRRRLEIDVAARAIVCESPAMRRVVEQVGLVARYDSPVLLRGESGTGKELLARRIHELSPRAGGPFLQVNCGALPEALVESELFGHERGAFTGADRRHQGRFERAAGGSLLLDEIGDLPPGAQAKLLRILQEGRFERVGGEEELRSDVRVMAATHRNLEEMVEKGSFRSDLNYRLNVFPIPVPPLRERPEDIPPLVDHLLSGVSRRLGMQVPRASRALLAWRAAHPWPGNVRQLANVLERAAILSLHGKLQVPPEPLARAKPSISGPRADGGPPAVETFHAASRRLIERALEATAGKVSGRGGAADLLDLNPSTLQSKIRKLGIARRRFARP